MYNFGPINQITNNKLNKNKVDKNSYNKYVRIKKNGCFYKKQPFFLFISISKDAFNSSPSLIG